MLKSLQREVIEMTKVRRNRIERLLLRGGALHRSRSESGEYKYTLCHPSEEVKMKQEEAHELLDEGSLVVITCGCNGFWWALRPDLVAMRASKSLVAAGGSSE
jgi:hypothetical protein